VLFVEKVSMLGAFVVQLSQASIGIGNRELYVFGLTCYPSLQREGHHCKDDESAFTSQNVNHRYANTRQEYDKRGATDRKKATGRKHLPT
jgi:hypothetical protein